MRGWRKIGYHFVILNGQTAGKYNEIFDGSFEIGRNLDEDFYLERNERGAHALGYNHNSIGICLIGNGVFTTKQFTQLFKLCVFLTRQYNIDIKNIKGHNEVGSTACPKFEVQIVRNVLDLINNAEV